ncbi:hypothetical protein AMTRI_Chr09g39520 [Amborella trichopoda]
MHATRALIGFNALVVLQCAQLQAIVCTTLPDFVQSRGSIRGGSGYGMGLAPVRVQTRTRNTTYGLVPGSVPDGSKESRPIPVYVPGIWITTWDLDLYPGQK